MLVATPSIAPVQWLLVICLGLCKCPCKLCWCSSAAALPAGPRPLPHEAAASLLAACLTHLLCPPIRRRCDKITIAPSLLAELEASTGHLPKVLWPSMGGCQEQHWHDFDEKMFTKLHGNDQMAVEKLAEGIKGFTADQDKLEVQLAKLANVL